MQNLGSNKKKIKNFGNWSIEVEEKIQIPEIQELKVKEEIMPIDITIAGMLSINHY
ncbi:MAG: hypothetical protein V4561_05550 [Bacteroidota bacterium]